MVRASAEGVKCKRGNSILSYLDFPFNVRSLLPFSHLSYRAASLGATSVVSQSMQLGSIIIPVIIYELIFLQKILILSDSLFATSIVTVTREMRLIFRRLNFTLHSLLYTSSSTDYRNGTRTSSCLDLDNSRNFVLAHSLWRAFGASSRPKSF